MNSTISNNKIPPGFWIALAMLITILIVRNCIGGVDP